MSRTTLFISHCETLPVCNALVMLRDVHGLAWDTRNIGSKNIRKNQKEHNLGPGRTCYLTFLSQRFGPTPFVRMMQE